MRSSDSCIFFCTEFVPCSINIENVTTVSISLEQMFSGFVSRFQDKFFCNKIFGIFRDFRTVRQLTWDRSLYGLFHPFSRIVILSMKNEDQRGLLDSDHQFDEMFYNGLYLYIGWVINATNFRLEGIVQKRGFDLNLTSSMNQFRLNSSSFYAHPLFQKGVTEKTFNFSLFHCPPHVIKLDNRSTLDRQVKLPYGDVLKSSKYELF